MQPIAGQASAPVATRGLAWAVVALALLLCAAGAARAQPAGPVVLGFSASLSGAHAAFGQGLLQGARLAVARANAAGGVGGRPLELLTLDDAGSPAKAAANVRTLLAQGALALTGPHGAETSAAAAQALLQDKAPVAALIGPASGAQPLRDPPRPGVFHLRAGLAEEAAAAVLHLDTIGITRYALVTQDDGLGDSGREQLMLELTRIAIRPLAVARIPAAASAPALHAALEQVCAAEPEALLLAVDGPAVTALVPLARQRRCASQMLAFSEAGNLPANAERPHPLRSLLVTQVMPHPGQRRHPLVADYLKASNDRPPTYAALEGYLALRALQAALAFCSRDLSRACVLRSLAMARLELPGTALQFGGAQRLARPYVEITMLDDEGRFRR